MRFTLLLYSLLSCASLALCSSIRVVYSPDSIELSDNHPIKSSSISDFLSLTLGYTIPKPIEWNGIAAITNVFELPKAIVTLEIDGDYRFEADESLYKKFPIIDLNDIDGQFEILSKRTYNRFADKEPLLLKMSVANEDLDDNAIGGNENLFKYLPVTASERLSIAVNDPEIKALLSDGTFNLKNDAIKLFITEIGTIKQLLNAVQKVKVSSKPKLWNSNRGVFWLQIHGLRQIKSSDLDDYTKSEAQRVMQNLIKTVTSNFRSLYNDKVMVTVIDNDDSMPLLVRRTRSLTQSVDDEKDEQGRVLNLAQDYDPNYHTAFSMLAFTTIVIALTVFGLGVAMWNMDPGRDTIIFRMTSQRKKDN